MTLRSRNGNTIGVHIKAIYKDKGGHSSLKVLESPPIFQGPGKLLKMDLVLKVLEFTEKDLGMCLNFSDNLCSRQRSES